MKFCEKCDNMYYMKVNEQSKLIFHITNLELTNNKFQKNIKKTFSYTYPSKETDHILKKRNIKNIEFFDLLKIVKISLIEDSDNLYDYIRGGSFILITISDCDFHSTNFNDYQFNNYGSYQFDNGSLRALGAYNGVLTSSDVTELYNWFSDKGYFS